MSVRVAIALSSLTLLGACDFGSESAFTADSVYDSCNSTIPVCNTTAGCKLVEEDKHIDGVFPGFRQMIVPTAGEAIIRIQIYFRSQLSPGVDTEIVWYEPACVDAYRYESQGVDLFEEAGGEAILLREERVFREGDHLIEIRSDATAEYILRTSVLTPEEWDQEQANVVEGSENLPIPFLP